MDNVNKHVLVILFEMYGARFVLRSWNFGRKLFNISMRPMSSVRHTLSFDAYDAYGFDIDHTLAKYNLPHLFTVRLRSAHMTDR